MVKQLQLSNYRYGYNYLTGDIDAGDYKSFIPYDNISQLQNETPSINKRTGKLQEYTRTDCGVIRLCVPVLNYTLAGLHGSILRNILDVDKNRWRDICDCVTLYDLQEEKEVSNVNLYVASKYLISTRYIYKLIDDFNIDEAVLDLLNEKFSVCFSRKGLDQNEPIVIRDINNNFHITDDMHLIEDYYLNPNLTTYLVSDYMNVKETKLRDLLNTSMSRLSMLLSLPKDKSSLYGMVAPFMIVLPYDYRRSTSSSETRMHPLSVLYQRVMEYNAGLLAYLSSSANTPNSYKEAYQSLENAVNAVYYDKNLLPSKQVNDATKSISKILSGKKGHIRGQCLGKRQDYSGRSVVTIHPYLSLNRINLPKPMILSMFEYHAFPYLVDRLNTADINSPIYGMSIMDLYSPIAARRKVMQDELFDIITNMDYEDGKCMLDCIPVYMGRQPTLHKHSFQSFFVGISPTNSIQVNPLVCPGYNMDFDGDQAYVNIPLSRQARNEVEKLMATSQTIYLPKTGKSTIEPRQDMLYGLYMCTRDDNYNHDFESHPEITTTKAAFNAICNNKIAVWDRVVIDGNSITAGDAAFMYCFREGDMPARNVSAPVTVAQISSKNIGSYVDYILSKENGHVPYSINSTESVPGTFIGTINHLVKLGFDVARYYPPNVSMVDTDVEVGDVTDGDITMNYETCIEDLYKRMEKYDFFYCMGLDTATTYQEYLSKEVEKVKSFIKNNVTKSLSNDNGYKLMAVSGARGNNDNLGQIFKYKGQIQKDSISSFDVVIGHGYKEQLTPMEFFINAYGGRQGQIDKSLKTGKTGYFGRKLWHATQGYSITTHDCGTTEGVELSYTFFEQNYPDTPEKLFASWLEDHHLISVIGADGLEKPMNNQLVTHDLAQKYAMDHNTVYKLRSPLYCKNPCCQLCYGIDPGTHEPPVIGDNVGLTAAESIGEISTQATMKTFQKGGSSGASAVSSSFERAEGFLTHKKMSYHTPGYDPVAWADGVTSKTPGTEPGTYLLKITSDDTTSYKKSIIVHQKMDITPESTKGVGLARIRGDYDINQLLEIMGVDYTQKYLVAKLREVYAPVAEVKMIHYEVLIAALTRYLILKTDRIHTKYQGDGRVEERALRVGMYATAQELYSGSTENTRYLKTLIPLNQIIISSNDALDYFQMEYVNRGLARTTLAHMTDTLNKPLNRMVMGKGLLTGSALDNYLEQSFRR